MDSRMRAQGGTVAGVDGGQVRAEARPARQAVAGNAVAGQAGRPPVLQGGRADEQGLSPLWIGAAGGAVAAGSAAPCCASRGWARKARTASVSLAQPQVGHRHGILGGQLPGGGIFGDHLARRLDEARQPRRSRRSVTPARSGPVGRSPPPSAWQGLHFSWKIASPLSARRALSRSAPPEAASCAPAELTARNRADGHRIERLRFSIVCPLGAFRSGKNSRQKQY